MCVDRLDQPEVQLFDELQVALNFFQHRVDNQCLASESTGEKVRIGAGYAIEELTKDHIGPFSDPCLSNKSSDVRSIILLAQFRQLIIPRRSFSESYHHPPRCSPGDKARAVAVEKEGDQFGDILRRSDAPFVIEKVARKSTPDAMGCVMSATFGLDFAMAASSVWLIYGLADRQ